MLTVISVECGYLSSRSYIIKVKEECWIVDCGDYPALKSHVEKPIKGILLTHGHFDHIRGLNELLAEYPNVAIYTNEIGKEMLIDPKKNLSHYQDSDFSFRTLSCIKIIKDREIIALDQNVNATAFFTPGHNPSCITWIIEECMFTGDSYIPGYDVVTKLPGGNRIHAKDSMVLIKELEVGRSIYPGHYRIDRSIDK